MVDVCAEVCPVVCCVCVRVFLIRQMPRLSLMSSDATTAPATKGNGYNPEKLGLVIYFSLHFISKKHTHTHKREAGRGGGVPEHKNVCGKK